MSPTAPKSTSQSGAGGLNPPRDAQKPAYGSLEADPWGSPALHKGHDHSGQGETTYANGTVASAPIRTTSTFTTSAEQTDASGAPPYESAQPPSAGVGGDGAGWGAEAPFSTSAGQGGFAAQGDGENTPRAATKPTSGAKRASSGIEEEVTVTSIDEKEGMFLFQHRNYEVVSVRRNSKVIRRYSDFVWLLDCLHKRYPFRQLPLLPPKRVASKYHVAASSHAG